MTVRKAQRQPKAPPPYFFTDDKVPVAQVGTPLPCPFCASTTVTLLCSEGEAGQGKTFYSAFAECGDCGARAAEASSNDEDVQNLRRLSEQHSLAFMTMVEAARRWNQRKGGAS